MNTSRYPGLGALSCACQNPGMSGLRDAASDAAQDQAQIDLMNRQIADAQAQADFMAKLATVTPGSTTTLAQDVAVPGQVFQSATGISPIQALSLGLQMANKTPQAKPVYVAAPSSGPSTGLILGGLAVLGVLGLAIGMGGRSSAPAAAKA